MPTITLDEYDKKRDFGRKTVRSACYAPHVSVFFDTLGQVRACCLNHTYALGHLGGQSLDAIWNGAEAQKLRESLENYDFGLGCEFCQWQIAENPSPHTLKYDQYPVDTNLPLWPANMEFNLSNACNLECVMCSGEYSSAIRSRRDKLPPLKKYYDEQFFADLRKYLPHVRAAQFLGGEPFLVPEHFKVWEMMIDEQVTTACQITTNGTQYNDRVERILDSLDCSITMSIDGITRENFEAIRVNAFFDSVMANFERFQQYSRRHNRTVTFNFSLMTLNWHEFGRFLLFADQHQCVVNVCPVVAPSRFSLFMLDQTELQRIVRELERQEEEVGRQLVFNKRVWTESIDQLRSRLQNSDDRSTSFVPAGFFESFSNANPDPLDDATAFSILREWSPNQPTTLVANSQDIITSVPTADFLGLLPSQCLHRSIDAILGLVRVTLGPMVNVLKWESNPTHIDRIIAFRTPMMEVTYVRLIIRPIRDSSGTNVGVRIDASKAIRLPTN